MAAQLLVLFALVAASLKSVSGHGVLLEPPNRSSLWRSDWKQPANYQDNQNSCGGFGTQYYENDGKCGPCGDNYADPVPRANENTGTYGNGIVQRTYPAGSVIDVVTNITSNHLGTITFSLCILPDVFKPEPDDCFVDIKFADGSAQYQVNAEDRIVQNKVQLPAGVANPRSVLRWTYRAGNNWGVCDDGTSGKGCGNQETFKLCSDIAIV